MALTHLKGLKITSSDGLIATGAAGVTIGTATITSGTLTTGNITTASLTSATVGALAVSSAANAMCGKRYIATAGTGPFSIATTKAKTSSRIMISPQVNKAGTVGSKINCCIGTIATGVGFSVKLTYGVTPTGCTGMVNWFIVNK